jgi:hypothetical protein
MDHNTLHRYTLSYQLKIAGVYNYDKEPDEGSFFVPDLRDHFISGTSDTRALANKEVDTMRRITGALAKNEDFRVFNDSQGGQESEGALSCLYEYNVNLMLQGNDNANHSLIKSISFDSSLGIEGQEGTVSPNVGSETRPKNVALVLAIRAK